MKGTIRITLFIVALVAFAGYMDGQDIKECRAKGNSVAYCFSIVG